MKLSIWKATLAIATIHSSYAESLLTVLCKIKCSHGCKSYKTPLRDCFNAHTYFPSDPSWSDYDIFDYLIDESNIKRIFYASTNSACIGEPTDEFVIPLHQCVGPWGEPRPWGILTRIDSNEGVST